jgi:hypothetical protein
VEKNIPNGTGELAETDTAAQNTNNGDLIYLLEIIGLARLVTGEEIYI